LALGTDTGGSIRQPASLCGAVGFKPTYGTVSRFGLVAYASSLDQIGPLAMTVRDAALLFQTIGGYDKNDSTSIPKYSPDVMTRLHEGVKGLILGVPEEYFSERLDTEVKSAVEHAIDLMAAEGMEIKPISFPNIRFSLPAYYLIANSEASSNLARYDGVRYGPREGAENLETMYTSTRKHGFGPEVKRRIMLGTFSLSEGHYNANYRKALKVRQLITNDFTRAFGEVDLIAGPTSPTQAFLLGDHLHDPLTMYACDRLTIPASLAGLPSISLPCGLTSDRLPVGFQIMGPPLADALVLRAAHAAESALNLSHRSELGQSMMNMMK
ncbi:MAG: amidase family protein, partial [Planctomycetota bacterium]